MQLFAKAFIITTPPVTLIDEEVKSSHCNGKEFFLFDFYSSFFKFLSMEDMI